MMTSSYSPTSVTTPLMDNQDESDDVENVPTTALIENKPGFHHSKSVFQMGV